MTTPAGHEDELIRFADDDGEGAAPLAADHGDRVWKILVIDDDDDVHQATRFSLEGVQLFGRPLKLLHATSAREARAVLEVTRDVAVVLLDVVMETPDAGLALVDHIRNTLRMLETRIVLRTGQPGYAPEHDTLLRYDINDYKTKSELTHHKLLTSITTTLRAYQQLCLIETSRRGLEQIVEASGALLRAEGLQRFAAGVITQIAAILGTRPEGVVCAQGQAKIPLVHVPYRGIAPLMTDLMGGQIDMAFLPMAGTIMQAIEDGRMKGLGVTAKQPHPLFSQYPALATMPGLESMEFEVWAGIFVHKDTPHHVIQRLNQAFYTALKDADVRKSLEATGNNVMPSRSVAELEGLFRKETERYRAIAKSIDLKAQAAQ